MFYVHRIEATKHKYITRRLLLASVPISKWVVVKTLLLKIIPMHGTRAQTFPFKNF